MNNQINTLSTQGSQVINPIWATEENYGMIDWTKKCLRNYANFSGRARRKEYWFFFLGMMIVSFILGILEAVLRTKGILGGLLGLAVFIPSIAVTVRRLHDIGKSGWWLLLALIPFIGAIVLFIWYVTDTKPETNEWGAPARRI